MYRTVSCAPRTPLFLVAVSCPFTLFRPVGDAADRMAAAAAAAMCSKSCDIVVLYTSAPVPAQHIYILLAFVAIVTIRVANE